MRGERGDREDQKERKEREESEVERSRSIKDTRRGLRRVLGCACVCLLGIPG